jgi:hypothetical protein
VYNPERRDAIKIAGQQDRHRGKEASCTAGAVGNLSGLLSLLSIYNCPAINMTAANTITNIALANCVTSFIPTRQHRGTWVFEGERQTCGLSSFSPAHLMKTGRLREAASQSTQYRRCTNRGLPGASRIPRG